eukprot:TRINITY_DN6284_c0_g1_i6.p1 TRINITY_DN6284_c0_g1~~TRINITY_DN6284_c0_g1_i6.p1  ORF type:complete len:167 (-),score=39.09 TRINITY_DN6284_c0_g1_i6:528-1028(-)
MSSCLFFRYFKVEELWERNFHGLELSEKQRAQVHMFLSYYNFRDLYFAAKREFCSRGPVSGKMNHVVLEKNPGLLKYVAKWISGFVRVQDVVMVGLDAVGKTTLLYKWNLGPLVQSIPTIGFCFEEVVYKSMRLISWDVGGSEKLPLWKGEAVVSTQSTGRLRAFL